MSRLGLTVLITWVLCSAVGIGAYSYVQLQDFHRFNPSPFIGIYHDYSSSHQRHHAPRADLLKTLTYKRYNGYIEENEDEDEDEYSFLDSDWPSDKDEDERRDSERVDKFKVNSKSQSNSRIKDGLSASMQQTLDFAAKLGVKSPRYKSDSYAPNYDTDDYDEGDDDFDPKKWSPKRQYAKDDDSYESAEDEDEDDSYETYDSGYASKYRRPNGRRDEYSRPSDRRSYLKSKYVSDRGEYRSRSYASEDDEDESYERANEKWYDEDENEDEDEDDYRYPEFSYSMQFRSENNFQRPKYAPPSRPSEVKIENNNNNVNKNSRQTLIRDDLTLSNGNKHFDYRKKYRLRY